MIESNDLTSAAVVVATAGTAVQITSTHTELRHGVYVKALIGNTGMLYVGNVSGDVTSANGIELDGGEGLWIPTRDLADLWFDVGTNGDAARVLYG